MVSHFGLFLLNFILELFRVAVEVWFFFICLHEVVPKIVPNRQLDILYGSSGQICREVLTAVLAKTDSGLM